MDNTPTSNIGKIEDTPLIEEMKRSYLDYAMSVIVSRALPDVRDGLKPVQRRVLFVMHELGLLRSSTFRKCAKIAGDTSGNYHPHGESNVYGALVNLTQDFSPNYDNTKKEPVVLPAAIPNLLLNGASGIAVGMATQIPPHNLGEVTDALIYMIDHPVKKLDSDVVIDTQLPLGKFHSDVTVEDLTQFIKGPDFPTGASIYDHSETLNAYATGRGRIVMRAKAEIEETKSGRYDIIITELPYQVNKATLVTRIADLYKEKKIDGIADLRDESDRRGMRVVIELKRDGKPQSLLNNLYKFTAMQSVFNVNMVALVDGVPHLMPLKHILEEFISHRQVIVRRRSEFELKEAKAREHILEGLKIAVDNIDEVISTIR